MAPTPTGRDPRGNLAPLSIPAQPQGIGMKSAPTDSRGQEHHSVGQHNIRGPPPMDNFGMSSSQPNSGHPGNAGQVLPALTQGLSNIATSPAPVGTTMKETAVDRETRGSSMYTTPAAPP